MRILLPVALVLALAACAGAPKKSASPPAPHRRGRRPAVATAAGRKQSPYAPAQEDPSKRGDYVAGGLYAPGVRDSAPDDDPRRRRDPRAGSHRRTAFAASATASRTRCSARATACSTPPMATSRAASPRTTARSSTAAAPPTSRCTTCTRSAPRTRRCRCRASRASPTSTTASRWSCASTIAGRSMPAASST